MGGSHHPARDEIRTPPLPFHHIFLVPPSQTPNRKSRNNSPTVQHRKLCPSPETDPLSAVKHLRRLFDKRTTSTPITHQKRQPRTPKSARQTAETAAKSLFM